MTKRTADELVAEGRHLSDHGALIVFLYPSQEWMAVELQMPFLRYERIPTNGERSPQGDDK